MNDITSKMLVWTIKSIPLKKSTKIKSFDKEIVGNQAHHNKLAKYTHVL